jgi:hypothetical protein
MAVMEWVLEVALVALLAATLFHAVRLERALGVLKRDRSALQDLIDGFNTSTRQAELGIERLRGVAEGTGLQIAGQLDAAVALKDDLTLLIDRGDRLADRIADADQAEPRVRSQAERDLLKALRMAR